MESGRMGYLSGIRRTPSLFPVPPVMRLGNLLKDSELSSYLIRSTGEKALTQGSSLAKKGAACKKSLYAVCPAKGWPGDPLWAALYGFCGHFSFSVPRKRPQMKRPATQTPTAKLPKEKMPTEKSPTEKIPMENRPAEKTPMEKRPAERTPLLKSPAESQPETAPKAAFGNGGASRPTSRRITYGIAITRTMAQGNPCFFIKPPPSPNHRCDCCALSRQSGVTAR